MIIVFIRKERMFLSSKFLEKVQNDELPDYISENEVKFINWLD